VVRAGQSLISIKTEVVITFLIPITLIAVPETRKSVIWGTREAELEVLSSRSRLTS
jgi:hypothetical protein